MPLLRPTRPFIGRPSGLRILRAAEREPPVVAGSHPGPGRQRTVACPRRGDMTRTALHSRMWLSPGRDSSGWGIVLGMPLRRSRREDVPTREVDLRGLLLEVAEELDIHGITVYLFGSRKDRTGSVRSDIDLLLFLDRRLTQDETHWLWGLEPYLDVFVARNGHAESVVNESELNDLDDQGLISTLGAVPLYLDGDWQGSADNLATQRVLAERNPAATMLPLYELYDAIPAERADVLVVTALTEEYEAVLAALDDEQPTDHSVRLTVTDDEGGDWLVRVVNMAEMGSVGAALKTRDALFRTKAFHVVLVGICAGVPGEVDLEDVVVPKSILYFESAKIGAGGEERGDESRECDPDVLRHAGVRAAALREEGITLLADGRVMASGEKVVANEVFRLGLQSRHRKLAAVDMESYGVVRAAEAAGRRATVIKGVCDMADEAKNDKHHKQAAEAAARVLLHLLRSGAFRSRS